MALISLHPTSALVPGMTAQERDGARVDQAIPRPRTARSRHPEEPLSPAALGSFLKDLRKWSSKLMKRTSDAHLWVVLLVILVGAALRISGIGQPITHDEALSYTRFSGRSYHTVFTDLSYPVNHVLHSALVRLSTSIFGLHLWSLRLPALLSGILVLPLFYAFVRSMFNRYIAIMALGLVAGSGCLIEAGSIAQGYSICWLCYITALMLGRHLVRTNNIVTAVLLSTVLALGMWSLPTGLYIALSVLGWTFIQISVKYRVSLNRRLGMLLFSGVLFVAMVVLLYLPIISTYGTAALFHHPAMGQSNWDVFLAGHQDGAFDLWAYFNGTAATWISLLGMAGMVFSMYISSKFRLLAFSLALASIPMVVVLTRVGEPVEWAHLLFLFNLSSAIALFYLLKAVQERVYTGFTKRLRTVLATLVLLVGMGYLGMKGIQDRLERFPEAIYAADWLKGILHADDRILVQYPWIAPLEFHMMAEGMDLGTLRNDPAKAVYVLVGPGDGQTLQEVLARQRYGGVVREPLEKVKDWRRLEIYGTD